MVREAVILAGGLGTRLRDTVPDLPKCMAPVAGRPFLSYVIDNLRMQGIQRFVFSLGYQWAVIDQYLQKEYPTLEFTCVIEEQPLGTGGAIRMAMQKVTQPEVVIANGDTLFKVNLKDVLSLYRSRNAECALSLKPMINSDRYGVVETDGNGRLTAFREKRFYANGLINGGVYLLGKDKFMQRPLPDRFSFEKEYLEKYVGEGNFYGCVQDGYFIDIGVPEDYRKAQEELKRTGLDLGRIDKSWTLFLDRDGVINEEKVGEYVTHWGEFIFSTGALQMFKKLGSVFGRIIVVSNQRGVGKGLMSEADLQSIHLEMQREVAIVQGKIDKIYYCTDKDDKCFNRKPNPGMALQAGQDFPDIDFSRSVMVGNKPGDMRFGRSAGMYTVFVTTTNPDQPFPHPDIDLVFPSLYDFASAL